MPNCSPACTRPLSKNGILIIDKAVGKTSFSLVSLLRRLTGIQKIGHAGTLDPFATGVMVMLIGPTYTKMADQFLQHDKKYEATIHLGVSTDSYDCEGGVTASCDRIPLHQEIETALEKFQGEVLQIPPMFSAKKVGGQRLYHLARKGMTVERQPVPVRLHTQLLAYEYPYLRISIACSKGTYIRSIAHDLGQLLGVGAHLSALRRTCSGPFTMEDAVHQDLLLENTYPWQERLIEH